MNFLLFILGTFGLMHVIVDGEILEPFRSFIDKYVTPRLASMVHCYQCMGFWAGALMSLFLISYNPLVVFIHACIGSYLGLLSPYILTFLDRNPGMHHTGGCRQCSEEARKQQQMQQQQQPEILTEV